MSSPFGRLPNRFLGCSFGHGGGGVTNTERVQVVLAVYHVKHLFPVLFLDFHIVDVLHHRNLAIHLACHLVEHEQAFLLMGEAVSAKHILFVENEDVVSSYWGKPGYVKLKVVAKSVDLKKIEFIDTFTVSFNVG